MPLQPRITVIPPRYEHRVEGDALAVSLFLTCPASGDEIQIVLPECELRDMLTAVQQAKGRILQEMTT